MQNIFDILDYNRDKCYKRLQENKFNTLCNFPLRDYDIEIMEELYDVKMTEISSDGYEFRKISLRSKN